MLWLLLLVGLLNVCKVQSVRCYSCSWTPGGAADAARNSEECKNAGTEVITCHDDEAPQICVTRLKMSSKDGPGRIFVGLFYQRHCLEEIYRSCSYVNPDSTSEPNEVYCKEDLCNTISYEEIKSKLI
jgi:hypothetical protein